MLAAGKTLGPYEIAGLLGSGGMGEVYRARDLRLGREVAVKILGGQVAHLPQARTRFERETRAVAALSHPNIVTIFDCGIEGEIVYAVTELLEGETLADRLRRGRLATEAAVQIAAQVADALAAAHGKGIIHRDIKPGNIFLCAAGGTKVLDFGLARWEAVAGTAAASGGSGGTIPLETHPGTLIGTVHYMSPEQVRGRPADARSDVFSLGCVLYEMTSGERPFSRETAAETMVAILNEEPPSLVEAGAPPALAAIVARCMAKDPFDRFQTAAELARALRDRLRQGTAEAASTAQGPAEEAHSDPEDAGEGSARRRRTEPESVQQMVEEARRWVSREIPKVAGRVREFSEEFTGEHPPAVVAGLSGKARRRLLWLGAAFLVFVAVRTVFNVKFLIPVAVAALALAIVLVAQDRRRGQAEARETWRLAPRQSDRPLVLTLVMCLFFGVFGAHRFYVGKIATGFLMLFTFGGFGIWMVIDLIVIAFGSFTDGEGRPIRRPF